MRRFRALTLLALLLGVTVPLAACGPFGGSTPTAVAPTTMPLSSATVAATVAPTATAPVVTATGAAPSVAPTTVPTTTPTTTPAATATSAPTATAVPTVSTPTTTVPVLRATVTQAPIPTVTLAPTEAAPTLVPVSPTALAGGGATDAQGRCAITLPPGFSAAGGGSFTGAGGRAVITLSSLDAAASETLDDVALPFVSNFTASIGDYQQTAVVRGADNLRLDFTGRTVAPGRGTIFLRQFGGTVCALSFFLVQGVEIAYDQTVNALLASLRPAASVGRIVRP